MPDEAIDHASVATTETPAENVRRIRTERAAMNEAEKAQLREDIKADIDAMNEFFREHGSPAELIRKYYGGPDEFDEAV